jgi:nitroreductase
VELGKQIFHLMEIPRDDMEKRTRWMERGFRYFDAPVAIIISVDKSLTEAGPLLDIEAVMQTICLTALNYGLGTCIENQGVMYPEVLRKIAGVPESKRIIISIAIGYPNWDFPANKVESSREPVEKITTWYDFE